MIDTNLNLSTIDRIFIASSLDAHVTNSEPSKKMLNRNQFIESFVRCAQVKYQMPKTVPESDKKLSIAVQKLIGDLKTNAYVLYPEPFREILWDQAGHNLFKHHEANLRHIIEIYKNSNDITEQNMTLANVIDLFSGPNSQCNIPEKDIIQIYALSKMTNIEELNDNSTNKYSRIRFVEFMELIARAADHTFKGSFQEDL